MSVGTKVSDTTTCASETDDGDYETSSEGHVRFSKEKGGIAPAELGSKFVQLDLRSEGEVSSKISNRKSILIKSESMPVLQKVSSNEEDTDSEQVVQTSDSTLACQRKIKVIVAKMAPLLSPWSNLSLATSSTSKTELNDEVYRARKMESRTKLPVLENPLLEPGTYLDPSPKDSTTDQFLPRGLGSSHTNHGSPSLLSGSVLNPESQADLIKIAQNAHSSIKSFYFPPSSMKREASSSQWRVKKDLDALLRIDGELGPLQQKLNEITGKFRAMNLTDPSLLRPGQYTSSTVSGYYLHRTQTFGANKPIHVTGQCHQMVSNPSWDARVVDNPPSPPFQSFRQENISLSHDVRPPRNSSSNDALLGQDSFIATRQVVGGSNSNWVAGESNSFVSMKNSWFEFEDGIKKDPSGSMIPNVSSSCYKCLKHRLDYQKPEFEAGTSGGFNMWERSRALDDPKQIDGGYRRHETIRDTESRPGGSGLPSGPRKHIDTMPNTICQPSTSTEPEVHVIRVNTTVEKHYGRIIAGDDRPEETSNSKQNSPELEEGPLKQNVSSMMLIGSSSSNKTRYVNYTRVDSQTSLIISKRDQAVGTSRPEETQLVSSTKDQMTNAKKKVRDLDIQCSGYNLRYHHQKEIVFRRSVESLLKQSPSDGNSSTSDQLKEVANTDEKVLVVPVLFVDGMPEPPSIPLFRFTKSKSSLAKPNHRMVMVRKRDVLRHNNLVSDTSAESLDMDDHLRMKMLSKDQWNSRMSLSVSRNPSLVCSKHHSQVSNSVCRQSDKCQRTGKGKTPGSMMSGSNHGIRTCSSSTKKGGKRVMLGLRSSPEDFLCDT